MNITECIFVELLEIQDGYLNKKLVLNDGVSYEQMIFDDLNKDIIII